MIIPSRLPSYFFSIWCVVVWSNFVALFLNMLLWLILMVLPRFYRISTRFHPEKAWPTLTFSVRVAIIQDGGNFSKSHPPSYDDDFRLNRSQKYSLIGRLSTNFNRGTKTGPHHMTFSCCDWIAGKFPVTQASKHTNKRVATCLFVPVPATLPVIALRHSTILSVRFSKRRCWMYRFLYQLCVSDWV